VKVISLEGALILDPKDTVATATVTLDAGKEIGYVVGGQERKITIIQDIPAGHKFALQDMHPGDNLYKYGEIIGKAFVEIRSGEHVHVHNVESLRGRGDLS
jgi:altronate dehydratase small subunit